MSAPGEIAAPAPGGPADPYAPFRQELLSPAEVRELSRLRPARSLRDALWLWAQIGAAWAAVAVWPAWWVLLPAIVVIGTREYALQVIGHDGIHRRLARDRRRNDWISDLLCMAPVGAITRINGRNHRIHHRLLARPEDPDRFKYDATAKESRARTLVFLFGLSGVWRVVKNVFLRPLRRVPVQAAPRRAGRGGSGGYTARDVALLVGWQGALAGGLTAAVGWWGYPALWLLPVYVFTFCANLSRQFLEHAHPAPEPEADVHRLKSFVSNPVERLFLAPCHMNHHIAHHLWPSIPYYNLPEAERRIRARSRSDRLHWERSYAAALGAWLAALPELSRQSFARAPRRT